MSEAGAVPTGWYSDPRSRFEHRYWDGNAWTNSVSTQGVPSEDPLGISVEPVAAATVRLPSGQQVAAAIPSRTTASDWPPARIIAIIGAGLLALGSLLPWARVSVGIFSRSVNGTDGDGKITLAAGVVAAVLFLVSSRKERVGLVFAIIAAAIGMITAGNDLVHISRVASENSSALVSASAGIGTYLCGIGGLAAVLGGLIYSSTSPPQAAH